MRYAPAGRRLAGERRGQGLAFEVGRRLASMVLTLFGVSVIVFLVLRLLPGNAITSSLGVSAGLLTHAQIVALDHYYGIGQP